MASKNVCALAAKDTSGVLSRKYIQRRSPLGNDVVIDIHYCGICHSDLHQVRGEWPIDHYYPMVAGHEIVGVVQSVGDEVTKFKVGDRVGVGCFVDSCRSCFQCKSGREQYCGGTSGKKDTLHLTYNCRLEDRGGELTMGGYSQAITVDENYVLSVPAGLDLEVAAPLLCAGITTWSPLVHLKVKEKGSALKVGIQGYGGLGQMGAKFAKSFGAETFVLSRTEKKRAEAEVLGLSYLATSDKAQMSKHKATFDVILSTISADYDINPFFDLLKGKATIHSAAC